MDTEQLNQILEDHATWLRDRHSGGSRANLSRANLSRANLSDTNLSDADLRRADLSDANLSRADLRRADLSGADLSDADLRGADLRRADLSGADLSDADLSGADLSDADLRGADLSGADIRRANLRGADLSGANLSDTCLSPRLTLLARLFAKECPTLRTGGRVVYRTAVSQFVGSTNYQPGRTYTAPVLSWSVETECHPGIYAASLQWMRQEFPYNTLVRCYVRDGEWTITAKGAIRCSRIRVLGYVEE